MLSSHFSNWNWNNWNSWNNRNTQPHSSLNFIELRSLFSYEALQCLTNLASHLQRIAVDREVLVYVQGLEVRTQRAVVPTGHRDQPAAEDAGVALQVHTGTDPLCTSPLVSGE